MSFFVDIHALQTLPPSNINRDDTGSPKSAIFGGVERTRVSSQSWKSVIRRDFECHLDSAKIGVRTRRIADKVVDRIIERDPAFDPDKAELVVREAFKAVKIKVEDPKKEGASRGVSSYLLFLSNQQIDRLAQAIIDADGEKIPAKDVKEILDTKHSVDIALFGRMLADAPDFNVDASCQVAHALGVHAVDTDFDYFTAVDDYVRNADDESGAGMIGTIEMASSTLYRYATVNLNALEANLGEPAATVEAALAFISAFVETMPTGKQNTFAARTLPEVVVVTIRDNRPISYVNAFEKPVVAKDSGRRLEATRALAQEAQSIQEAYGYEPVSSYVFALGDLKAELEGLGEEVTLPQLKEKLEGKLTELLSQEA
ncbi:MAG: type I-E CRISPR-associated protein Cas7/Cse4/CasC [Rothia sp. (in: high G+C Gram-positive bacteria)]|uniref:type I-E CRISPR-associated protein Cas7/Cse4/CasC n=1 Tax=Rothia sp. (in: high G+C Gram-positive bacteria) TaxID=1885016 RepID=UPI0026DF2F92|nr:type I-E CRISPR-associated protein Cas7/Cse4/CasC [Rothia sp. (in: high G+C Gram-positive bacteria)]MDO5750834.1 type I-E CRISPR-associated protein Cas7/Cse4/CasC [Rothia sp. (in: high G+C Gram-positive bacteria)]